MEKTFLQTIEQGKIDNDKHIKHDRFFLPYPGQRKKLSKKETPHHSARSGSFLK
jgi:hypothetical protein